MQYRPGSEIGTVLTASVEGAAHIRLIGECDMYTAPLVQEHLETLLDGGETRVIFDLEHVTFLDSTILRIFLNARQCCPTGEVILLCRPGFISRLLRLLEMDQLLRVCTPEEWRQQIATVH